MRFKAWKILRKNKKGHWIFWDVYKTKKEANEVMKRDQKRYVSQNFKIEGTNEPTGGP